MPFMGAERRCGGRAPSPPDGGTAGVVAGADMAASKNYAFVFQLDTLRQCQGRQRSEQRRIILPKAQFSMSQNRPACSFRCSRASDVFISRNLGRFGFDTEI
jgi:hypothetical protein